MLNNNDKQKKSYSNPRDFYNNENILSEEILSEHEEIDNNDLYIIKTVKITYENGESVIVTKKIISDKNNDSILD